jgi:hypothetical protein
LAASVAGQIAIVVLALAGIGGVVVARAAVHFADALRTERARQRPAAGEHRRTAPAAAVHAPPAEPGTVAWLYDLHPNATRWESP